MSEAILLLQIEHKNMSGLLDIVAQQLEEDGPLDLELLKNIITYFSDYPDLCHHPIENLIFRKLQYLDSTAADNVKEILHEHKTISELTTVLKASLEPTAHGDNQSTLRKHARKFIDHYRTHIKLEEEIFFPMALKTLTSNDWDAIDFDLYDRRDPLVDVEVEARFRSLSDKIFKLADRNKHNDLLVRKSRQLEQLTTIKAYNDVMNNAGYNYRLFEYPEGGYGLRFEDKVVIDIPECSQARAAWCAYFYVKAATKSI